MTPESLNKKKAETLIISVGTLGHHGSKIATAFITGQTEGPHFTELGRLKEKWRDGKNVRQTGHSTESMKSPTEANVFIQS